MKIKTFMDNEKHFADRHDSNKKRKQDQNRIRGGGPGKDKSKGGDAKDQSKKQGVIVNPCKYHDGKHAWHDCIHNKFGPNYRLDKIPPKRDGGRGGGSSSR